MNELSEVRRQKFTTDGVRWHDYAKLFPMLEGDAAAAFESDVRQNGVREPIVFYQGQLLDGRNRYMAARACGIEYPYVEYIGNDPLAYVVSLNLSRRHLSESQRGMVAAKLANMRQGERTDVEPSANLQKVSQSDAATMLNVSERTVATAAKVKEQGAPELVAAVESGLVSVSAAADVAELPKDEQAVVVARGEKEILEAAKAIRGKRVEAKRAIKVEQANAIAARNAELPATERKYGVIYADPPWAYEVWSGAGTDRAAENHYPTMDIESIKRLPVGGLAADDCALFMWAVMPQLPDAFEVLKAWGFEFKTVAFVWVKTTMDGDRPATGMGYWTRANAEICLLATKGAPTRLNADVHQIVQSPRLEHSRKPDDVAERIERLVPGPFIELFCRRPRHGWDVWGNQAEGSDAA